MKKKINEKKQNRALIFGLGTIAIVLIAILLINSNSGKKTTQVLKLATTTSTYDSGLLDYIIPDFENKYNTKVEVISVGTGQAIKNGENGDVDVILVHAPESEKKFVERGYGVTRHCVMFNEFLIVGPAEDPAGIIGMKTIDALKKIESTKSIFISRGDNSGTDKKEKELWLDANISPQKEDWYLETGSGMGDALRIANEKRGYILSDMGTYLSLKSTMDLVSIVEGDIPTLNNPYGVIQVNPEKYPNLNAKGASDFINWIMSEDTQELIESYKKEGKRLFTGLRGQCV